MGAAQVNYLLGGDCMNFFVSLCSSNNFFFACLYLETVILHKIIMAHISLLFLLVEIIFDLISSFKWIIFWESRYMQQLVQYKFFSFCFLKLDMIWSYDDSIVGLYVLEYQMPHLNKVMSVLISVMVIIYVFLYNFYAWKVGTRYKVM